MESVATVKVAFLIITYTNPQQTLRMIERLRHPDFDFYIHVDKKQALETHSILFNLPQVFFVRNRVDVRWAGFSTVQSMLVSIEEVLSSGKNYDFLHLLSGQCYPIKTIAEIHSFFAQHKGQQFMGAKHFYRDWREAIPRIERYHLTSLRLPGKYRLQWLINTIVGRRKPPPHFEFFGKSMFWTITLPCAQYVIDFFKQHKRFRWWAFFTWAPDEFLIATVVMNSPFAESVVPENLLYVDMPEGTSHPKILDMEDLPTLQSSSKLFARKFNMKEKPAIFDALDKWHS